VGITVVFSGASLILAGISSYFFRYFLTLVFFTVYFGVLSLCVRLVGEDLIYGN
jgi:hypothetical protein